MVLTDLKDVKIGNSQISGIFIGNVKIWPSGDTPDIPDTPDNPDNPPVVTNIEITRCVCIAPYNNDLQKTTENDIRLVLFQTNVNEKIDNITVAFKEAGGPKIFGPLYIGNGAYYIAFKDNYVYEGGYSKSDTISDFNISIPGTSVYTIPGKGDDNTDHSPYVRINNLVGFSRIKLIPDSGLTYRWPVSGFAYNAHEIVRVSDKICDIYSLTENWQRTLSRRYTLQPYTVFPENGTSMASAVFDNPIVRGDVGITISVSPNNSYLPRIGYLELNSSNLNTGEPMIKEIFIQDGVRTKIGLIQSNYLGDITFDVTTYLLMLNLNELDEKEFTLTREFRTSKLYFLSTTISNEISVFKNNIELNPTITPSVTHYSLSNGTYTLKIKKKNS